MVQKVPFKTFSFTLMDGRTCHVRLVTEDDAPVLCEFLPQSHQESDFLQFMPGEFTKTVEQEREYLRERLANDSCLQVALEVDGELVGLGGAWSTEYRRFAHHAELGLTVRKVYWGLGIGRNLMEFIVEWGRQRGLHKIYLRVFAHNLRAVKLYLAMGFVEEGRLKEDLLRRDGSYGDTIIMAFYYADEV